MVINTQRTYIFAPDIRRTWQVEKRNVRMKVETHNDVKHSSDTFLHAVLGALQYVSGGTAPPVATESKDGRILVEFRVHLETSWTARNSPVAAPPLPHAHLYE